MASTLPLVFVARGFWLGLDRYTYQPAVLAALGLTWARGPIEETPALRRAGLALAGVALGLAARQEQVLAALGLLRLAALGGHDGEGLAGPLGAVVGVQRE